MGALVAGTRYRGDFEERVKQVLDALDKQDARDPLHRRDPHAGRRRFGVGRHDGCRQPAEAGAGVGQAALHRIDDVLRREAVVRQGSRAVAALPEDRSARADRSGDDRDPQGPEEGVRIASRRDVSGRDARGRGDAVDAAPEGSASARQGDRRDRRGRRGEETARRSPDQASRKTSPSASHRRRHRDGSSRRSRACRCRPCRATTRWR